MSIKLSTPWHKKSFNLFLEDSLPQLLAERLPLVGYRVEAGDPGTTRIHVTLASGKNGDVEVTYTGIPQPDADGLFTIEGEPWVVVPVAEDEDLANTTIHCVGEQLYEAVASRLGKAPRDMTWEADLVRAWLPLEAWIEEFFQTHAQRLDTTNWLSRHTHLRRLIVQNWENVVTPGQVGRVCPFEMPEGPNLGRVFTIAVGAEVRDGKLVVVDERPEAGLGLSASMIPFIEHSDSNRLLMGANMLRQCIVPERPEPALVQTGNEPEAPGFWNGRDLLTAFVSWDVDTFSDGIVLSESAARRLDSPYPAEVGDKLCNRHGTKGVVSRVLPDEEMPHLADGTPVELVYNFASLHRRLNFGQIREALMSRIARAKGRPAIVPPFQAPSAEELRQQLTAAGLPESGMERLRLGRDGEELPRPSTVGWVYWGRTVHLSRSKVRISDSAEWAQRQGELEAYALREVGAYENLRELLNTRSVRRADIDTLAGRLAAGPVEQAEAPTPMFADLVERLSVAGITANLEDGKLTFRLGPPRGERLKLARPLPHPWLSEHMLSATGALPDLEAYPGLVEANQRLASALRGGAPERLVQDAQANLENRLKAFFDTLLKPEHLRFGDRLAFSARAVITPGAGLRLDQVGIAEEICWALFAAQLTRELGDAEAVKARTEQATQALDEIMGRAWVLINRAPTLTPAAMIAFHPVRDPANVVRLHPLVCHMLNADFDGDQVAILLPVTEAAQREAGERLSVAAHLERDPGLLKYLLPPLDALWGLANLSLTQAGRKGTSRILKRPLPEGLLTGETLASLVEQTLEAEGIPATLETVEALTRLGFAEAKRSGASLSPFAGEGLGLPPEPATDEIERWGAYGEELVEAIAARSDYADPNIGAQVLMVKARGVGLVQLTWLVACDGAVTDVHGNTIPIRHSMVAGLTPEEMYAVTNRARRGLANYLGEYEGMRDNLRARYQPSGFNVLSRARRSEHPGVVFARAAASGEVDPLSDVESRLLVGLPIPG